MGGLLLSSFYFVLALLVAQSSSFETQLAEIVDLCCEYGDLERALNRCRDYTAENLDSISLEITLPLAEIYLTYSSLELILNADMETASQLRKRGKSLNAAALPPLAKLHINGQVCGGLNEVFYSSAIAVQTYVMNELTVQPFESMTQLITLVSDVGLHKAAETHINKAFEMYPSEAALKFRAALMTPGVYESEEHLSTTRTLLEQRIDTIYESAMTGDLVIKGLNEFVLSPTFYFVYQGIPPIPPTHPYYISYIPLYTFMHTYAHLYTPMPPIKVKPTSSCSRSYTPLTPLHTLYSVE